ncbi:hypothetical protein Nepgr_027532 [Nepenthes gracilis]|uniref:Uncharacterized protein n=1 Tax=Nepenthes gracilis TaxID=150966 RepID=A0AAD3TAI1_NEPGR|nr:hypothetical protein Nepgr_027532 [Nepenthes gracilis]
MYDRRWHWKTMMKTEKVKGKRGVPAEESRGKEGENGSTVSGEGKTVRLEVCNWPRCREKAGRSREGRGETGNYQISSPSALPL